MSDSGHKSFAKIPSTSLLRGLILDSSEETRFVTRFFLNSLQVTTEESPLGKDGLRRILEEPFDFVVLDQKLRDMSCEEFLRCLEDAALEHRPRVILVSPFPIPDDMPLPVAAVLQKPFTVGSLEDAIWGLFPT